MKPSLISLEAQEDLLPHICKAINMKTLTLVILSTSICLAQFEENHWIYGSAGFSLGNYSGSHVGINYVFKKTFSLQLGYSQVFRAPDQEPDDYREPFLDRYPRDAIYSWYFLPGVNIKIKDKPKIRFNISMGVASTYMNLKVNYVQIGYFSYFLFGIAPEYVFEERRVNVVSLVIKPSFEWAFSKYAGLRLSPYWLRNSEKASGGLEVSVLFGLVREKKSVYKSAPY